MAEQTTTKAAAVWNPPRLSKLAFGSTDSGTKMPSIPGENIYEGAPHWVPAQGTCNYRMPLSSESALPYCEL